jgi:hypothetical protein
MDFYINYNNELHMKLDKIINEKIKRPPRKNTQLYLTIMFLKNHDLSKWFKLQDVITFVEKTKIFSDRKRGIALFFNEKTCGHWDVGSKNGDKILKFKPYILYNTQRVFGDNFDKKVSKKIIERANHRCEICKNSIEHIGYNIDHIKGRVLGGNGNYENGALLCKQCNNRKKENSLEHFSLNILKDIFKLKQRIEPEKDFASFLTSIIELSN